MAQSVCALAVNRKVGGSSPPGDGSFCFNPPKIIINNIFRYFRDRYHYWSFDG